MQQLVVAFFAPIVRALVDVAVEALSSPSQVNRIRMVVNTVKSDGMQTVPDTTRYDDAAQSAITKSGMADVDLPDEWTDPRRVR